MKTFMFPNFTFSSGPITASGEQRTQNAFGDPPLPHSSTRHTHNLFFVCHMVPIFLPLCLWVVVVECGKSGARREFPFFVHTCWMMCVAVVRSEGDRGNFREGFIPKFRRRLEASSQSEYQKELVNFFEVYSCVACQALDSLIFRSRAFGQ